MDLLAQGPDFNESETSKILRFVRTPEGRGFAIVRESFVEAWILHSDIAHMKCLGRWDNADLVAVLDCGRRTALYTERDEVSTLTVHQSPAPKSSCSITVPRLISLFCLPNGSNSDIVGITPSFDIFRVTIVTHSDTIFQLRPQVSARLPTDVTLSLVIPVDPMAWSGSTAPGCGREHDTLLSISESGELAFWSFAEDHHQTRWRCTGRVRTGKSGYRLARCSSAKKTALGRRKSRIERNRY